MKYDYIRKRFQQELVVEILQWKALQWSGQLTGTNIERTETHDVCQEGEEKIKGQKRGGIKRSQLPEVEEFYNSKIFCPVYNTVQKKSGDPNTS